MGLRKGMGRGWEGTGAYVPEKQGIKSDGLCALLRHQWERHPEKEGMERCKFCRKTRKAKGQ
jgi:hypothetical protein